MGTACGSANQQSVLATIAAWLLVQTEISVSWTGMKPSTDIYGPRRMDSKDSGDPRTFHLAPPSD